MGSFTAIVSGASTRSVDVNQIVTALNGTSNSQLPVTNAPGTPMLPLIFTSAPGSDSVGAGVAVTGDTVNRIALYVRGSDGYGGISAGAGGSTTAHLYAQGSGWQIDESLTISTNLTVAGGTTLASFNTSGNGTVGGTLSITGTTTVNFLSLGRGGLRQLTAFSGSAAGTFTHGCSSTPDWIGITENVAFSTMTVGVDSIGSSTVHVNVGVNGNAWIGIALKNA